MSQEVTLPSGHTVKIRDPHTLLKKDRDKVTELAGNAENEMMRASLIQDGLVAISVIEWSFDLIPPSIRMASLGELTPKDFDALLKACEPAASALFPDMEATEESEKDPKVITANSNE